MCERKKAFGTVEMIALENPTQSVGGADLVFRRRGADPLPPQIDREKERLDIFREYVTLNKKSGEIALTKPIDATATHPCNNHKNRYFCAFDRYLFYLTSATDTPMCYPLQKQLLN